MRYILLLMLLISVFCVMQASVAQQKADIIIINGKISLLDDHNSEAEAVAITGNRIAITGTNSQVLKLKGRETKLVDGKGNRVIPGLFDSHLHVIRGGRFYNSELRWDGVKTLKRALEMLKEQAERTPEGQWVRVVGGWNEYQFLEKRLPTLKEINDATGDVPAFILYLYSKAWLNKAGLRKLNIDSASANPPGGLIEKDDEGNPTGLLVAEPNAFILYSTLARLPELTVAEKVNSTLQYISELNRLGVTAVMDAGGGFQNFPDDYLITDSLNRLGKINVRLPFFLFAQKKGTETADYARWSGIVDLDAKHDNGVNEIEYYIKGAGENLVADAADFENFLFPRPDLPHSMETNLKAVLLLLVKNRWPFRLHATYDESITRDLNVIEEVNAELPLNGLTWFIDHAETVSEDNLKRIKKLGGGIAIQHRMAYQGENFIHRYGKNKASEAPPLKKMISMNIPVGLGTDGTRVASYNPWIALYWATTGNTIGGVRMMSPENTLTRTAALKLLTAGSYSLIKEAYKGRIQKGYYADLVILDKDYMSVSDEEIKSIQSKLTIVDGKVVYADRDYVSMAPESLPIIPSWSPVKFFKPFE